MKRRRRWLLPVAAGVIACAGCAPSTPDGGIVRVFAAASLGPALAEMDASFEAKTGTRVEVNLAASAALARQIASGASADIYLSADPVWADWLAERDLVQQGRAVLGNGLVLVAPHDAPVAIASPDDLAKESVARIAMGDPEYVPAGAYGREALTALGVWDAVKDKAVFAADVRQALAYVERGDVDAGIVYRSDAASNERVRIVSSLDSALDRPVRYVVAFVGRAGDDPVATAYVAYLRSPEAGRVFEAHGFDVVGEGTT